MVCPRDLIQVNIDIKMMRCENHTKKMVIVNSKPNGLTRSVMSFSSINFMTLRSAGDNSIH